MENARHKPRLQEPIERPNRDIHFDVLRDIGGTHSFTMLYDKLLLAFHPERGCPFVSLAKNVQRRKC